MNQLTKEEAVALSQSGWWRGLEPRQIVGFQLFEDRLCMPPSDFHKAVEEALGHAVWTHQFGSEGIEQLRKEFLGERQAPTFQEILELIPAEKRILVLLDKPGAK